MIENAYRIIFKTKKNKFVDEFYDSESAIRSLCEELHTGLFTCQDFLDMYEDCKDESDPEYMKEYKNIGESEEFSDYAYFVDYDVDGPEYIGEDLGIETFLELSKRFKNKYNFEIIDDTIYDLVSQIKENIEELKRAELDSVVYIREFGSHLENALDYINYIEENNTKYL